MNSKSQLQMPSFVGNPSSPALCFPATKTTKIERQQTTLCGCQKAPKSRCISAIGVFILVIAYTVMGSILFVSLEGDLEESDGIETAVAASKPYPRNNEANNAELRTRTVDRLWSITEDLNILYKENWTRLAAQEVQIFQETILHALKLSRAQQILNVKQPNTPYKWTYASAFLYSLTLITTIGCGGVSPKSQWGRIAALLYALFGIPIILLYLSTMGDGLSSAMRCIFKRLRAPSSKTSSQTSSSNSNSTSSSTPTSSASNNILSEATNNKNKILESEKRHNYMNNNNNNNSSSNMHNSSNTSSSNGNQMKKHKQSSGVPISICILILICYITLGAVLFHELQKWGVLESLYFCFTALSTIGTGDLQPKNDIGLYAASAYIIVGMAIVAMCFSLIQTELIIWLRKFAIQEQQEDDDEIALVNVAMTPIKS
ncbi:unnamed protein product [Diamesa hyperborea]